jgi:hypothetical protein
MPYRKRQYLALRRVQCGFDSTLGLSLWLLRKKLEIAPIRELPISWRDSAREIEGGFLSSGDNRDVLLRCLRNRVEIISHLEPLPPNRMVFVRVGVYV